MDTKVLIDYCEVQTLQKWETAEALLKTKRYADCLFFCHLTLEFVLKREVVIRTKKPFPMIHDLQDLAKRSKLPFPKSYQKSLAVINTFNVAGRYDNYKLAFYKKAKPVFTKKYFKITKDVLIWLKKQSTNTQ